LKIMPRDPEQRDPTASATAERSDDWSQAADARRQAVACPVPEAGSADVPTCATGPMGRLVFVWRELVGILRARAGTGQG